MYLSDGRLKVKHALYSLNLGARWNILPSSFTPFISGKVLCNQFGKTHLELTDLYSSTTYRSQLREQFRIGLALGGGIRIGLLLRLEARLEADYAWSNLFLAQKNEKRQALFSADLMIHYKLRQIKRDH
jgi:hypothetical protein